MPSRRLLWQRFLRIVTATIAGHHGWLMGLPDLRAFRGSLCRLIFHPMFLRAPRLAMSSATTSFCEITKPAGAGVQPDPQSGRRGSRKGGAFTVLIKLVCLRPFRTLNHPYLNNGATSSAKSNSE